MGEYFINTDKKTIERYDMSKFMEFNGDYYDVLTSSFLNSLKKLKVVGRYVVVGEENRPDLLSLNVYGNTQYWWILLLFNDILSEEDLVTGTIIKYPSESDLEDLFFSLKAKESAKD